MLDIRTPLALAFTLSVLCVAVVPAHAQANSADGRIVTSSSAAQAEEEPDVKSAAPSVDSAWAMLNSAAHRSTQTRIVTMAALGTMDSNPDAAQLISAGMNDPELEVRTAAVLAAGQTMNRKLIPALRGKLDDKEPQVVFIAAATLWKMHDHSGEDVLFSVADGQRKATPGLMHGAKNDVNRELHNPAALATLGATEGASMLLGPFGFGVMAFNYMRRSGSDPARAVAIKLLAENRTAAVQRELIDALHDKDPSVRAAAAKALGERHDGALTRPLGELFVDPKLPVRLTAAAAYINCARASARHAHARLQ